MGLKIKPLLFISLGWLFVALACIGLFLPLLPTTPFLLLALACFAEHSPRFHQMLLNHRWFGPPLQEWQAHKRLSVHVKKRIYLIVCISFLISICLLWARTELQLLLAGLCLILLWFISRLPESESE